jgi:CHAT domain-containing protein
MVVSALWPVHDRSSRDFMTRLHEIWYHGNAEDQMTLSGSLRRLQAEVARDGRHPASWAPFIATGRG